MKWMRCRHDGRELWGTLEGDMLAVHEGDLFGAHRASGERVPVAGVEWLTPCRPGKMLALWNNFARRRREERLGRAGRAALLRQDAQQLYGTRPDHCRAFARGRPRSLRG